MNAATPLLAIAHRAGNDLRTLRTALDRGVDLVETDVHLFRGRLELRHHKAFGRRLLWDDGRLSRRADVAVPELEQLIVALDGDGRVMLDLKGIHPGLARRVAATLHEMAPGTPYTVCTQHWWMLRAFARYPNIRVVLSVGSRRRLHRVLPRLRRSAAYGVSVHRRLLTPSVTASLREAAAVVMTWPVDSHEALTSVRGLGVVGVISKSTAVLDRVVRDRDDQTRSANRDSATLSRQPGVRSDR